MDHLLLPRGEELLKNKAPGRTPSGLQQQQVEPDPETQKIHQTISVMSVKSSEIRQGASQNYNYETPASVASSTKVKLAKSQPRMSKKKASMRNKRPENNDTKSELSCLNIEVPRKDVSYVSKGRSKKKAKRNEQVDNYEKESLQHELISTE